MKKISFVFGIILLITPLFSESGKVFQRIDRWNLEGAFGIECYSLIDADNHIVAGFGSSGNKIITPNKVIEFAPRGEGPNELTNLKTVFFYKSDLAFVEMANKIKVFTKRGDTYVWKETKWLKRGYWAHFIKEGLFVDNKIFLSGMEGIDLKKEPRKYSLLRIYNDEGKPLKRLIIKQFKKPNSFHDLRYHLALHNSDDVFFMAANELKLYIVSAKSLEVKKEISLKTPSFYKAMPEQFYSWKKYESSRQYLKDLETWDMGYSGIQEMAVEKDRLIIQIRTADATKTKFALLFYDANTFELERIEFIDDFLLGVKEGKYYCYANGNPGRDEGTDSCIINIYRFMDKK